VRQFSAVVTLKLKWAREVLILLTAVFGCCIGQRLTLFALVSGNSMEPTLESGQVLRLHHGLPPQIPRGTIVLVSQFPLPPCIKRVVDLPHETISFRMGEVFVDRKMLREMYLPECQTTFSWKHEQLVAQADEYVLLGDNRLTRQDSREYGVIKRSSIIGKIELPSPPAQFLPHPSYRIAKHRHQVPPRQAGL